MLPAAEIADLKNGRLIQKLQEELAVARSRCDELQVCCLFNFNLFLQFVCSKSC
jgi:hypothetical protein